MIDFISGRLVKSSPGKVIIEVGGIGFQVMVPTSPERPAGEIGDKVTYYIRLVFKENELMLYGFTEPLERDFFNLVTGVSGFGPKLGLSMLGLLPVSQIYRAIMAEDTSLLCRIPGVGRKISQRLILELKDKLPLLIPADEIPVAAEEGLPEEDLTEALVSLGYTKAEAVAAMGKVYRENAGRIPKEEILRLALQRLAGR